MSASVESSCKSKTSQSPNEGIDRLLYDAAIHPGTIFDTSLLEAALNSTTPGSKNTLLHLAATVGNLTFIRQLLQLNALKMDPQRRNHYVKAINTQGNTSLHLAAQGGFLSVVDFLLQQDESGVDIHNNLRETALFNACESGNLPTVKMLLKRDPSSLRLRTKGDQTCLNVAINRGDSELVDHILKSLEATDLIHEKDKPLHLAVARDDVHIISSLIEFDPQLCYCVNGNGETPLCMAVKLGHLEAVKKLIACRPDAVEITDASGKNVLHFAAQGSQMGIAEYLNDTVCLSGLVNQGAGKPITDTEPIESGDTPLHIAARKKNVDMVDSLLHIRGIKKHILNEAGLTALDIAKEMTEYDESYRIIALLANYPSRRRPFLYSTPKVSSRKQANAREKVSKIYDDRRNIELVVTVLLATISFTAPFTFANGGENGNPAMLGCVSFKLFLIFDFVAFTLSLVVVLMWQIGMTLTTGQKLMFIRVTNILVCASFAFTAFAFMAALYAMFADKVKAFAYFVLGVNSILLGLGSLAFFYFGAKFSVRMARVNHLRGGVLYYPDPLVENVWKTLESCGALDLVRKSERMVPPILRGNCWQKIRSGTVKSSAMAQGEVV